MNLNKLHCNVQHLYLLSQITLQPPKDIDAPNAQRQFDVI